MSDEPLNAAEANEAIPATTFDNLCESLNNIAAMLRKMDDDLNKTGGHMDRMASSLDQMNRTMATSQDVSRLHRAASAIETLPPGACGRPKAMFSATTKHSVTQPIRQKQGMYR